jgi:hypothetical protein
MRTHWNTGNRYTSFGQRIVAEQRPDGTIAFHDIDRGIGGVLTERSGYHGADRGADKVFPPTDNPYTIRHYVDAQYTQGYAYRDDFTVGFPWAVET